MEIGKIASPCFQPGPTSLKAALASASGHQSCSGELFGSRRDCQLLLNVPPRLSLPGTDGCTVPLPDGIIDVAFLSNILEHVRDLAAVRAAPTIDWARVPLHKPSTRPAVVLKISGVYRNTINKTVFL